MGVMYVPSSGVVAIALLLNASLFVVWFIAFWPVLRFNMGHALMFAAAFGLLIMLLVLPLLFGIVRKEGKPPEPVVMHAVAERHYSSTTSSSREMATI
jgi:hypothetical protein